MSRRPFTIELTEAELRAAVRSLDIAITVSASGSHRVTFRPLGKPLRGSDGSERTAARRVLKRLLETLPKPEETS